MGVATSERWERTHPHQQHRLFLNRALNVKFTNLMHRFGLNFILWRGYGTPPQITPRSIGASRLARGLRSLHHPPNKKSWIHPWVHPDCENAGYSSAAGVSNVHLPPCEVGYWIPVSVWWRSGKAQRLALYLYHSAVSINC